MAQNIRKEIEQKLNEIETQRGVQILLAVESGSRAWGFASPDSDYDVRFIYMRPAKDYLRLDSPRDVIEWQLDEVLDINGWDLKKALIQFQKGNATLFEWSNSPIVYAVRPAWEQVYAAARNYFSVKTALYHYYGTLMSSTFRVIWCGIRNISMPCGLFWPQGILNNTISRLPSCSTAIGTGVN